jgi:hypothetical protein
VKEQLTQKQSGWTAKKTREQPVIKPSISCFTTHKECHLIGGTLFWFSRFCLAVPFLGGTCFAVPREQQHCCFCVFFGVMRYAT